jgi:hypothetical protein
MCKAKAQRRMRLFALVLVWSSSMVFIGRSKANDRQIFEPDGSTSFRGDQLIFNQVFRVHDCQVI